MKESSSIYVQCATKCLLQFHSPPFRLLSNQTKFVVVVFFSSFFSREDFFLQMTWRSYRKMPFCGTSRQTMKVEIRAVQEWHKIVIVNVLLSKHINPSSFFHWGWKDLKVSRLCNVNISVKMQETENSQSTINSDWCVLPCVPSINRRGAFPLTCPMSFCCRSLSDLSSAICSRSSFSLMSEDCCTLCNSVSNNLKSRPECWHEVTRRWFHTEVSSPSTNNMYTSSA